MVVILSRNITDLQKKNIYSFLEGRGRAVKEIVGKQETVLGAVGEAVVDIREVAVLPGVDRVLPISKPYKMASREFKKEDTVVKIGPVKIGGSRIAVIAGPCAVESREQMIEAAWAAKAAGAVMLRGGAYKPRTSPYSFQGMGVEGLKILKEASLETGMPFATEVVSPQFIEQMEPYVDCYQIGARNMQNFELLKAVGQTRKPVILKRGLAATIEEWLMAAEYLLASGTDDVILCERGIRTFETYTRNTLDLSAIPVVKKLSHLPVIVDPSHATGIRDKVLPMALAAVAAGADGLIIEMHPHPDQAVSDGAQSLYPSQLEKLMRDVEVLAPVVGKELARLPLDIKPEQSKNEGRELGKGINVAFQGEHGAYSEIAVNAAFEEENLNTVPSESFKQVFDHVLSEKVPFGIIPMENSLAGPIYENFDLLYMYPDLKIIGEVKVRVQHHLIGVPGASIDDIKQVYSHPQGLAQCDRFLKSLPGRQTMPFYDTAGAVGFIAEKGEKSNAAIASREAARFYGMSILKEGIETNPHNYTRFAILALNEYKIKAEVQKVSVAFSLPDEPGSLSKCLQIFSENGLNMTRIESRPIEGKPWDYMFFIDLEFPENNNLYDSVETELKNQTEGFRCLGIYPVY